MNLNASQAKAELAKRELARRRLLDFIKYNFPEYRVNWHHRLLIDKLEAVERGEIKRLIVTMPPRHGKSEVCSIQLPAWYIGRNPEKNIIATSYSSDLATDFGRQVRNLVDTPEYKGIFEARLAEDSMARGRWNTDKDGAYFAVGVGGAVTGRGADLLLIDDPIKNRKDADSQVVRDAVWDWYTSTARTRLSPTGAQVVIQTRWHEDDLAGRLLRSENADKWVVLDLPAIATKDEEFRKEGEALWADQYSLESLLETKKDIGPYDWSALYQQRPVDDASREFKSDWYHRIDAEKVSLMNTRNYLTVDTAMSQRESADFCGFCDNSVSQDNIWFLKAWKSRLSPNEFVNALFTLYSRRNYEIIGIEKTAYTDGLKPYLDEEQRKRNVFLPIFELKHNQTAKEVRIRGLIPRYASGSIFHIDGQCTDLETEQASFPNGAHDDVLDATAYQLQLNPEGPTRDRSMERRIQQNRERKDGLYE